MKYQTLESKDTNNQNMKLKNITSVLIVNFIITLLVVYIFTSTVNILNMIRNNFSVIIALEVSYSRFL